MDSNLYLATKEEGEIPKGGRYYGGMNFLGHLIQPERGLRFNILLLTLVIVYVIFTNRARGLYCCIKMRAEGERLYTTIKSDHKVCKSLLKFTFCLVSH